MWKNMAAIMHKQKRGAPTNQAIRLSILQDQLILLIWLFVLYLPNVASELKVLKKLATLFWPDSGMVCKQAIAIFAMESTSLAAWFAGSESNSSSVREASGIFFFFFLVLPIAGFLKKQKRS